MRILRITKMRKKNQSFTSGKISFRKMQKFADSGKYLVPHSSLKYQILPTNGGGKNTSPKTHHVLNIFSRLRFNSKLWQSIHF